MIRLDLVIILMALAVSTLGFIPLFPWLENFPRIFLPGVILLRLFADRRGFKLNSNVVTGCSVALFFFYLLRLTTSDIIGPAVNLLVMLLGVRFLGEKCARNFLQIFLLSLFCTAASSLYSLDAIFMLYLGLQIIILEIALVLLVCYDRDPGATLSIPQFRSLLVVPLVMLTLSLPLLMVFFVILPRTQLPLWEFMAGQGRKSTGFSEMVQPGSAATVGETKSIVFRAECGRLSPSELYWRGITLNRFDGVRWSRRASPAGERFAPGKGRLVTQRLFLEPGSSRYLLALDLPTQLSGVRGVTYSPDFTMSRNFTSGKRITYDIASAVGGATRGHLGVVRGFYLETPEQLPTWFRQQGHYLRGRGKSDVQRLAAVEELFRREELVYATTGLPVTEEPMVAFFTTNKRGNCEFFASSCGLLLRLAGVPARLVGGYQGGEYNELGGYYVVTEAQAHVWVEAYLEGAGWVRVDPTRWAVNAQEVGTPDTRSIFRTFLLATDALTYFWNRQIITYDLERQMALFTQGGRQLQGLTLPTPKSFLRILIPVALPFLLWWVINYVRRRPSVEIRLVTSFILQLRRLYGVKTSSAAGLNELIVGIDSPDVAQFVDIYHGALYRDRRLLPEEVRALHEIVRRMQKLIF